jgi:putative membrane protein
MKRIITAALLVAASTWVACTPDKKTEETEIAEEVAAAEEDTSGTTAATDTTLTEDKKELLQTLAQHNLLQVAIGRLASTKSTNNDVKQNGQRMVQLYTNSQTKLQDLAQTYGMPLDTVLQEDYRKHIEDLTKLKAADFDKKYLEKVTDVQKDALGSFDNILKDNVEADASGFGIWARTSEKELRAQYEQALTLQQQLKNDQ